jgi:hypothetical protein
VDAAEDKALKRALDRAAVAAVGHLPPLPTPAPQAGHRFTLQS